MLEVSSRKSELALGDYPLELGDFLKGILKIPRNLQARLAVRHMDDPKETFETINEILEIPTNFAYDVRGFQRGISHDENQEPFRAKTFDPENFPPVNLEYFYKIVQYCKDRQIRLICYSPCFSPTRLLSENHGDEYAYFSQLTQQCQIPFYDLSYARKEYLDYTDEDFVDLEGHVMGALADRQSALLKKAADSDDPDQYFYPSYDEVMEKFE